MNSITGIVALVLLTTSTVVAQISGQFAPDSLTRGLWHLNESEGIVVSDTSVFGNTGIANGTTIVPGRFGNARSFNGNGDYVSILSSAAFNFDTSGFIVDVWFNTTAENGFLIRRGLAPVPGFDINLTHGKLGCEVGNRRDGAWPDTILAFFSDTTYNDGNWHLATLVRDRQARTISLYADGKLVAPPHNDPVTFPISSDRPVTLGCWEYLPQADYFSGIIDEVRISSGRQIVLPVGITVDPLSLDFDLVRVGSADTLSLKIRNTGSVDTLRVTSVTSSNPVFRQSPEAMTLPPGSTGSLEVYYTPIATQKDSATLAIASNDSQIPVVSVHLFGRGYTLSEEPLIKSVIHINSYYGDARLIWFRSILDTAASIDPVTEYSIWRRVNGGDMSNGPIRPPANPSSRQNDPLWDFLGTVPAVQFNEYTAVEPLVYDYSSGNPWSVYIVAAHTHTGGFYFSDPDSLQYYDVIVTATSARPSLPGAFNLHQNYPNPFNPTTTLCYDLPRDMHVTLRVYDLLGRIVATLVHEQRSAGTHTVTWDGSAVSSGLYFSRLEADGRSMTRKMLLIR